MLMRAPNGAVIDARESAVERLVAAGFSAVEPERKPVQRKRQERRVAPKKDEDAKD